MRYNNQVLFPYKQTPAKILATSADNSLKVCLCDHLRLRMDEYEQIPRVSMQQVILGSSLFYFFNPHKKIFHFRLEV